MYVLANNSAIISSPIYMQCRNKALDISKLLCLIVHQLNLVDLLTGVFIDVLCYKYADFILNI